MENDDHRDGEPVEYAEDLVAIGAAVDSELMLHDRYIERVQRRRRPQLRGVGSWYEVLNDIRADNLFESVDHPDDAASAAVRNEVGPKRGGERGEAALGRGIATQESNRQGHR
jgi:hypothetical protein